MICILCGLKIEKQVPIIISQIEMLPPCSDDGIVGKDILSNKYSCHKCYKDVLSNAAKAAHEVSDLLIEKGKD